MELLTAALTWEHVSINAELKVFFSKVTAQLNENPTKKILHLPT